MKLLEVTVPKKAERSAKEILSNYSSDIRSTEIERKDEKAIEFAVTVDSSDIDEITEKLKALKTIESGKLIINVLQQETLIQKGQKTKGSLSTLSQNEIYSKAQQFGGLTRAQWGLIMLSSAIAAYGLALDNVIVVIGAMMLAPILSPFVAGAISLTVGDKRLMKQTLKSGALSVLLTVAVSFVAVSFIPVSRNATLELVTSPGIVSILLSLLVGSAAALTFASDLRDQVAGVAVAIALVPPLAAVGIALNLGDLVFALNAASVATINILSVIVSGYVTFSFLGLKPDTYYKKKNAEDIRKIVVAAFVFILLIASSIGFFSYQSYESYLNQQQLESNADAFFGEDLLEIRTDERSATILVIGNHNETEFKNSFDGDMDIRVRKLQEIE